MPIRSFVLAVVACMTASSPAEAQMKQFRDWHAACDNTRRCVAYGIVSTFSLGYLRVARDGAADAKPVVTLAVHQAKRMNFTLSFDRRAPDILPPGTYVPDKVEDDEYVRLSIDAPVETLVTALRKATRIIITPTHEPEMWSYATLAGAIDALAWIDRQQKRAGTVTAMVARGRKPASAVPAPPEPPRVSAVAKPDPDPPAPGYPPLLVQKGRAACGKEEQEPDPRDVHRLGTDLLMYWFFCPAYSGAYNLNYALLLVPEGDPERARAAVLKYPPLVAQVEKRRRGAAYNVEFDSGSMTLQVFEAGRSASDCGAYSEWVWDGKAFQLALYKKMPECAGIYSSDWPVLWRTQRN